MFKNMKVAVKLGLGFALVLALLVVVASIGITRLAKLNEGTNDITDNMWPKVLLLQDGLAGVNAIGFGARDMMLATNKEAVQKAKEDMLEGRAGIGKAWEKLKPTLVNPKGKAMMEAILESRTEFISAQNQLIKLAETGKVDEGKRFLDSDFRSTAQEYRKRVDALIKFQGDLMNETGDAAEAAYQEARSLVLMLAAVAIALAVLVGVVITRSLTKQLGGEPGYAAEMVSRIANGDLTVNVQTKSNDSSSMLFAIKGMVERLSGIISEVRGSADELSSASEEVSATAQSMSQATSEQAASVEETSASIEQMSASINQNTENAKVTDGMASQAAKQAIEGGEAVKQTVAAMKSIAGKISIIDDIAYQTNLLALNAAIEAARAGEHGKGFAVVAAEVRKLAERSQVAAQEIGELATGSVEKAESAGKLLDDMVPSINKTSDLVQEITAASEEQSSGVGQINTAMNQLNQITQQNASSSEELAATAEEMSGQAAQLQEQMAFFKIGEDASKALTATAVRKAKPSQLAGRKALAAALHVDEAEFMKF